MDQPLIVQAEYSFKGGNNDELCFKKGDLITVTQREEGGWWEGTLNDKTGWFPSNYVMEYKAPLPITDSLRPPEEIQEYRSVVLNDLLDSERAHVAEIQGLLENFLEPLQQTQILNADEYAQLMCNFVEVVKTHEELLTQMEECNDRVGKLFLNKAPFMKQVHQAYCAQHPKAIVILDKYKDELEKYMERQGAATPGLLVLTTGLSKPFRRLDKYSAMLQELERHMESSHPDRGDTQRSVAVYKDIAATCSATRRQKELELQVLTGPVRGWQGQELSSLGEIIHMGSVAVGPDHRDRYFVLFPQTLLILSVSQRMSAFIYEGKLPLTGIIVNRLEDSDTYKNAFEINSPLIDRIVAVCQGPNDANKWVELLTTSNASMPIGIKRQLSNLSNASMSGGHISTPPSHFSHNLDARGYCTRFSLCAYYSTAQPASHGITFPSSNYPPTAPYAGLTDHFAKLVKKGQLKGILIKMLLYPQSRQSIDMKCIPLRKKRCHKVSKKLIKKLTEDVARSCSSDKSELERQDAFELPTDSESEGEDDDFEFLKSGSDKCDFGDGSFISTGTFIDHGSGAATPQKPRGCSSINLINLDSISDDESKPWKKESLVIGSNTMRAIARKSSDQSFIIHTSKAHLDFGSCETSQEKLLLLQQQKSETSDKSSCYNGRGGAYLACENLADLSDETKIKNTSSKLAVSPTERHSMPNMFVGNRFNRSSKTAVYVPTWKDRQDMQNQSADIVESGEITENAEVHSSCLDLPASCRDAPDKLTAELLYNCEYSDVIAPPSMYKTFYRSQSQGTSNDPCTTSQTELCIEPRRLSKESQKRESVKRCISYHYVPLCNETASQPNSNNLNIDLRNETSENPTQPASQNRVQHRFGNGDEVDGHRTSTKCKCCESSQCPSPRSSDSGLAGSCTITSPDPPQNEEAYMAYYDVDGSLKLISKTDYTAEPNDLKRFDICGTFREKFLETIQQDNLSPLESAPPQALPTTLTSTTVEFQINRKSIFINSAAPTNVTEKATSSSSNQEHSEELNPETGMFRSGMYAHWWKKETLPKDVIQGIAKVYNKRLLPSTQSSKESRCSICSSCFCSMEASGFSEGATYCSICQDCISFCSSSRNELAANTTTTITDAECPFCYTTRYSMQRNSYCNSTASTSVSPTSSFDCPICSGAHIARPDSLGSIKEDIQLQQQQQQQAFVEDVPTSQSQPVKSTNEQSAAATTTSTVTTDSNERTGGEREPSNSSDNNSTSPRRTAAAIGGTSVTTQTEPFVQSSSQLQPIHAHSASTTSSNASSSTTTTKSTKSSSGSSKPQIKFSPDIKQYFEDNGPSSSSTKHGHKRKDRKHKSITNMRPAPPLRPNLLNSSTTSGSSGSRSDGGVASLNTLSSYCSGRKNQPTFEEDALVLRVFEAYCAAYQNNTRNTIHSALQPWTPCLPIRGGKLKTSKHVSTSNPHLPFLCNTGVQFSGSTNVNSKQNSTSSLNSSYIWREASPNNFNLYSSSISSLNATGYRYSLTGSTGGAGGGVAPNNVSLGGSGLDYRALSEERATRKSLNRLKSGFGSGYDNIFMTPLLPRKNKGSPKIVKNAYQRPPTPVRNVSEDRQSSTSSVNKQLPNHPGLYDRRLNRSFETSTSHRYAGYGGGYMMGYGLKSTSLRRSTPQLPADGVDSDDPDCHQLAQKGCTEALLRNGHGTAATGSTTNCTGGNGDGDSQGHADNWCCGNFVMKQWRKINNY